MPPFEPPPLDPAIPGSLPPPDIPVAPPLWVLDAETWIFAARPSGDTRPAPTASHNPNNDHSILQGLPNGTYHPLEALHPSALAPLSAPGASEQYRGGLPQIMIVRYKDSSVGPYDELIYIAGKFVCPHEPNSTALRIGTIYVSTTASVWNGRRNWNIPKHLARFEWTPSPTDPNTQTLRVFHPPSVPAPLSPSTPFFAATLTRSRLPALPLNTAKLPFAARALRIVAPPLLRGRYPPGHEDGRAVIGTDEPENARANPWLEIVPTYRGRLGLAYIEAVEEGTLRRFGDGVGYPEVRPFWIGARMEGFIDFPVAETVGGKEE